MLFFRIGSRGCGFKSRHPYLEENGKPGTFSQTAVYNPQFYFVIVAQLAEQTAVNRQVTGSTPVISVIGSYINMWLKKQNHYAVKFGNNLDNMSR